uniref:Integrase core domain containing protein n=1 Tax=Solanum tuberosum TaxID=4113 RepID=M1DVB3_SOLTU
MGGFRPNSQGSHSENWRQGQGNLGRNYGYYNREGHYVRDGNFNRDNNYNRNNYGKRNDRVGRYVPPQNRESGSRDTGGNMAQNGLVQRPTDPIDGPSFNSRTVDGVRRSQRFPRGHSGPPLLTPSHVYFFICAGTLECRSGIVTVRSYCCPVGQGTEVRGSDGHSVASHPAVDAKSIAVSVAASMAPSSSRSTPQLGATVVPLARVQKLEAQMATVLHHIQPWMQKSIAVSVVRMERRMEGMMDRKVQAVNKCLDAFELRVLERSAPAIDLSALQADLASLRSYVDAILAAPSVKTQVAPNALADDTVLDALFSGTAKEGLAPTYAKGKRHRSHHTEEERAHKR